MADQRSAAEILGRTGIPHRFDDGGELRADYSGRSMTRPSDVEDLHAAGYAVSHVDFDNRTVIYAPVDHGMGGLI